MKVLVADDSKINLILISVSLKKLGHEVMEASSGQEAIDMFKQQRPDLIILDVVMEGIDGYECAKRIRALSKNDWIPIIFLSFNIDDQSVAKGIDAGGDDYLTKPFSEITLAAKIKAMQRIADMQHKLFELTKKLSLQSSTDALTGLYNRFQFDKTIQERIAHASRHNKLLSLLFLDLDNFKSINDSFGHQVGDLLLQEIAQRLRSCLRLDDFIARIGGDEFAIILSEAKNPQVAGDIANKIMKALSKPYDLLGNEVYISSSIGISCYPFSEALPGDLAKNADIAMYHAKQLGRNNFQYFTKELNEEYKKKLSLENVLKTAIVRNEFFLMYQPIFDLQTKKIVRIEALSCLKHPEFGTVSADIFIPLAEETGLIEPIGSWALQTAAEQAALWYLQGYRGFKLAINLSPRQLLHKNLLQLITHILKKIAIPPSLLELELTETSEIDYSKISEEVVKKIHNMGISISLDDFGTGFSSLSHIKRLPIDAIKIDKIFVKDVITLRKDATIIKALISLGKQLGLDIVAEGIETEEQLQFLIANDCPQGQGFYLSKVISAEEMVKLLEKN